VQNSDQFKKTNKSFIYKVNFVIFSLIFCLGLANLIFSNILATKGVELNHYLAQTVDLNKRNQELQNKLYDLTSLHAIEQKALDLGFVNTQNILTLSPLSPQMASVE